MKIVEIVKWLFCLFLCGFIVWVGWHKINILEGLFALLVGSVCMGLCLVGLVAEIFSKG